MRVSGWEYVAVLAATTALTLLLTPLALRVAVRRQILDVPSDIKAQSSAVPYLGGMAITVAFTLAVVGAALVRSNTRGVDELLVILGAAVILALIGLLDDLRNLDPFVRLAAEACAGLLVWLYADPVSIFDVAPLDGTVTVLWIVAVTNAFNLLDNMDGLSAGTAAIAALSVFVLGAANGQFLVATLAIGLAGCALGFLRSNFHPARIYMGDAGSLFLGFLLAVLTAKLRFDAPRSATFAVPVVLLGVPLFDMALVTVNRLWHGRSPLTGGRDHTSHRLVFVGIPVPYTVTLIYAGAVSLGALGILMSRLDTGSSMLLFGWMVVVGALLFALLSQVPVYETSRRRHLMIREVRRAEGDGGAAA